MTRSPAENAELALLLEVAGTPKPGNVDRHRDHDDLRFAQFLAGAVGAREGLAMAERGGGVGDAFERAVAGMRRQEGGNTQFGCLLLLVPLVRTVGSGDLSRSRAADVCAATTAADAAGFYRAFDHVDVSVPAPPDGLAVPDVRRGSEAVDTLHERGLSLYDVMADAAERDGNAREWVEGFPRTFAAAERLRAADGPVEERVSRAFLRLLAEREDGVVRRTAGPAAAREVTERAQAALAGEEDPETLADEFVERGINPGTTADVTAAAVFVALQRGMAV